MRCALALILVFTAGQNALAQSGSDIYAMLADVSTFCATMAKADPRTLNLAEQSIDSVKREIATIAALRVRHDKVAADAVAARARVVAQRRDIEELKTQLSSLSPTMVEERQLFSADLTGRLEVLDRYRQTEAMLEIELAEIEDQVLATNPPAAAFIQAMVSASEGALRRCIADRRQHFR